MRVLLVCLLLAALTGCTRSYYRRSADRETFAAVQERNCDPRWSSPLSVYTPPESRLHDPFNPDRSPMPPDDPAAHRYMHCANGIRGALHWHKDGDAPWVEDPYWRVFLELDQNGTLVLTPERAVELGVLDSREYQTQREDLYLSALALTFNRFEFDLQWYLTNDTLWTHFGSGANEQNTLTTTTNFGFSRFFPAGGQLLVNFANTYVFQFAGPNQTATQSNITYNFIQPILRNFGRKVRMEALTEGERLLLYQLRTFARFRKTYAFNIATDGYLRLLAQEQQVRNQQANLSSFEQNLRLHEALFVSGIVSSVKVDQVYQGLQQARLGLIQAEAGLETQQDLYKIALGLPPNLPIRLDDSVLNPFQLSAPALDAYQRDLDAFMTSYRELDEPPPLVKLEEGFRRLQEYQEEFPVLADQIEGEIERWRRRLQDAREDEEGARRERAAVADRARDLAEARADHRDLVARTARSALRVAEDRRKEDWEELLELTGDLVDLAAQLFVIQTQARVYLIDLQTVPYTEQQAVEFALDNRLDLMNQRGAVTDAWREITVKASALMAGLDIIVSGDIATKPGGTNPFDFRSSASSYSVGWQFDGPLNRLAQRNEYRATLIAYQQARRQFMLLQDQIERAIRQDLRNLRTSRLSFEIARQSLIIAARQLEAAREELFLLGANADPTSTQNILNALNDVLRAKNALIDSWVSYETARYQLYLDMELLQVNERGTYVADFNTADNQSSTPDDSSGAGGDATDAPQPHREAGSP
jgi:outer membrane protein TolC